MNESVIPVGGSIEGHEIVISSASKTNRIRDIGLFLVVCVWFVSAFFWWRDAANKEMLYAEIAEAHKIEMAKFRAEIATLRKEQNKAVLLKEEIAKELLHHREVVLKAFNAHDARLTRAIQILECLEKKGKKD